ncbi:MAG: ABC transporter ATP-binding protein/permease [Actinobacteria bacterium]|nr:ABC transporter ATP-binding protein/permease [Actinomycetota bacterium]
MTPTPQPQKVRAPLVRGTMTLIGIAFRASPWRAALGFFMTIVQNSSNVLIALLIKFVIDAVVKGDVSRAVLVAGLLGLTWTIVIAAAVAGFMITQGLQERASMQIDRNIIELTAGLATIEHHERPEYLDQLQLLRDKRDQISQAIQAVVQNLSFLANLFGTFGLLIYIHPLLALLPLFGIPSLFGGARFQRIMIRADEDVSEQRRFANHLFDLATIAAPAKELRIFGIGPEIHARHDRTLLENDRHLNSARIRGTVWFALGWSFFAIGFVLAMLFVVDRAIHGLASLGDVVLAMTLASRVNQNVAQGVGMVTWLVETMKTVSRYLWLTDFARERRRVVKDPVAVPSRIARGIDVEEVTFRYPGTDADVLRDVTLHIPAGSTVAIVGENGAGKTTLVKLLGRFYEPAEGRIALDGLDIARFPVEEWRARMSGGFQDFARFEFVAREVVGVGDIPQMDDELVVVGALERASAGDVVPTLARGFDTQLGKSFDDGIELSGGQWQKLALGRAMMREEPLLLVLDEPTAALDAQTEHALFERYHGAARRVAQQTGAITIFVSHRFSTVRMADLIIVIDDGRVVEAGSHAELTARGGLYAELYELQARAYR